MMKIGRRSFLHCFVGFAAVFIALQLIIILAILNFSQRVVAEREYHVARNILDIYDSNISSALNSADADLSALIFDTSSMKLLSNPSALSRYHAGYALLQAMASRIAGNKELDALVIANGQYAPPLVVRSARISYRFSQTIKDYLAGLFQGSGVRNSGWQVAVLDGESVLCHYYHLQDNIICALIKLSTLGDLYKPFFDEAQMLVMTDPDGVPWLEINGGGAMRLQYPLRPALEGTRIENGYAVSTESVAGGQVCLSYIAVPGAFDLDQAGGIVVLVTGVATLLFVLGFILYSRREIIAPVRAMMETIRAVERGDLNHRPRVRCWNDEFRTLAQAFGGMLDQIIHLRIESYERIIEYKNMELKYRAMQIRPHFFLNALSNLHSTCYKNGNQKACAFIDALTRNIRYMFKAGMRTVRADEEVAHIENYLACQEILYPGCVFSHISVAAEARAWPIPQMLVHTFVENVFKHVISPENVTTLLIQISVEERDGERMALVTVEDDGPGFPASVLEARPGGGMPEDASGGHIGLTGVTRMLQLMYGRQRLMELDNKPSGGAVVRAFIPARTAPELIALPMIYCAKAARDFRAEQGAEPKE